MKQILSISIVLISLVLMPACRKAQVFQDKGWKITSSPEDETISLSQTELGLVFNQLQMFLRNGEEPVRCSGWEVTAGQGTVLITTEKPQQTQWTIRVSETGIDFSCTDPKGFIQGIAPAGEQRIPCRVASQDNDIMYTQMGFVSATNIHNLFDMKTDFLIRFPVGSRLTRNEQDNRLMNIEVQLQDGEEILLIKDYYTSEVGLRDNQKTTFKPAYTPIPDHFKSAPTGWSSWYCYYMDATAESLTEETDALAGKLKPYGLKYVQLDAAYTRGPQANWLEWNQELFPEGGKVWFKHVIENGLVPGLWLNIYGANYTKPAMADQYPENFYLRNKSGKLVQACCSADSTVVRLDYTNPEVIHKHLKPLFETLVNDWGLGYLKAAGWGTWMDYYEENRDHAFNPDMDSREAYRKGLESVRNIMGDDGYIVGCAMHEIGVGFDFYNGSRSGGDDYANWSGEGHWSGGMQTFFNSLFGAGYLNGICWWSDPDDVMIRDPLTFDEAKTIVSTISLSGQAYIFSDFVAEFSKERLQKFLSSEYNIGWARDYPQLVKPLPPEKLALYQKTMPAMPIKAMDLYPYKTKPACCPEPTSYPKALDLKVNAVSGQYDVVSLYNWTGQDTIKTLDLHKDLGLVPGKAYLAFDFWNTIMLPVNNNTIRESIPKHGAKAIIIRPFLKRPQLLATSRHLTAAYSILELKWDPDELRLSGVSKTVPGDRYDLYFYIPDHVNTGQVTASVGHVEKKLLDDHLLQVSFQGSETTVDWSVQFL